MKTPMLFKNMTFEKFFLLQLSKYVPIKTKVLRAYVPYISKTFLKYLIRENTNLNNAKNGSF